MYRYGKYKFILSYNFFGFGQAEKSGSTSKYPNYSAQATMQVQSTGSMSSGTDERATNKPKGGAGSSRNPSIPTGAAYESATLLELMKRQALIRLPKDGAQSLDDPLLKNGGQLSAEESAREAGAAGNRLRNRLMRADGVHASDDLHTDALPLGIWNRMQVTDSSTATGSGPPRAGPDSGWTDVNSGQQQRVRFRQAAGAGVKQSSGPSSAVSEAEASSPSQRRQSMTFVNRIERVLALAAGSSELPLATSDFAKQLLVYTPTPRTQAAKDVKGLGKCLVVGGIESQQTNDTKHMSRSEANLAAVGTARRTHIDSGLQHDGDGRTAIEQKPIEIPVNNLRVQQQIPANSTTSSNAYLHSNH